MMYKRALVLNEAKLDLLSFQPHSKSNIYIFTFTWNNLQLHVTRDHDKMSPKLSGIKINI